MPSRSATGQGGGGLSGLQTGLETLVSGAYVAMDPGPKGSKRRTHFVGLEKPPSVRRDQPGSVYFLQADTIGGIGEGLRPARLERSGPRRVAVPDLDLVAVGEHPADEAGAHQAGAEKCNLHRALPVVPSHARRRIDECATVGPFGLDPAARCDGPDAARPAIKSSS